jgi:hypothetical protein
VFLDAFIPYMIALVVGVALVPAYDGLQKAITALKSLPAPVTQLVLGVVNFGLNYAAQVKFAALECAPNCDVTQIAQGDLNLLLTAITSAAAMFGFKAHKTQKSIANALTKPARDLGA